MEASNNLLTMLPKENLLMVRKLFYILRLCKIETKKLKQN